VAVFALSAVDLGAILGVWAHPDDEVYLSGGLMAPCRPIRPKCHRCHGNRRGAGTPDPERWPPEKLGPLREKELQQAMAALGVSDIRWLGYDDGMCSTVSAD
jgi:LmbE family N-acetylglucosaminyl deacetylase